jgi:hypothetical protein
MESLRAQFRRGPRSIAVLRVVVAGAAIAFGCGHETTNSPRDRATVTCPPIVPAWAPNTSYAAGAIVGYDGAIYQCLQGHMSLPDWIPPAVPALWTAVQCAGRPSADLSIPVADLGNPGSGRPDLGNPPVQPDAGARASCAEWFSGVGPASQWVHTDPNGKLVYKTLPTGDRIMDFSFAGYMAGGVSIPSVSVQQTIAPSGTDDTAAIQSAIDAVSALPLSNGFRGAVVLQAGSYSVSTPLSISASGVVVRGAGSGANGTTIKMTGQPHSAFNIVGTGSYQTIGSAASMIDAYVPSGAVSFHVNDATGFAVGNAVLVRRPVTAAWVQLMGMDTLVRNGVHQTWLGVGGTITTDRTIAAISGNLITLDVPLSDNFDAQYLSPPGGSIVKYTFPGRISQIGLEDLLVVGPALNVPISQPQYTVLQMNDVIDAWVRNIVVQDTQNSFSIGERAKRVTLENVNITHTIAHTGDGMADFSISGTQTLVDRCSSNGSGSWPILTQGQQTGPSAVVHFTSDQPSGIAPHQRWATGLLADDCQFPNSPNGSPGVAFWDRGTHGSGQGWTLGWGVAWNVTTTFVLVQRPPGAENWCIGCGGAIVERAPLGSSAVPPDGIFESSGIPVSPSSLYLAQLCDRLGPQAVTNIGY